MNIAIIQARMGSTRLPGKVFKDLSGRTVLEHVVSRVKESKLIDEVVVATTSDKKDLAIVDFCARREIRVFIGSENDVLDRYYQAARLFSPSNVARITSDCPMIDPDIIDAIIQTHVEGKFDYTSNTLEETFPDGLDAEVFTFNSLALSWRESILQSEREHVTAYMKKHPEKFKLKSITNDVDLSSMRWTIDQEDDLKFLDKIFRRLYPTKPAFRTQDVLREIQKDPDLLKINGGIRRNEGYLKSLMND